MSRTEMQVVIVVMVTVVLLNVPINNCVPMVERDFHSLNQQLNYSDR